MHFVFALELSDINLWNKDLLDTHLDLLSPDKYTNIPSKYFVCLHIFITSSTRLQHNNFSSFKTPYKMSSRRLQDVLEDVKLLRWRRVEDVFKTCLEDVFKTKKCLLGLFPWAHVAWKLSQHTISFCTPINIVN